MIKVDGKTDNACWRLHHEQVWRQPCSLAYAEGWLRDCQRGDILVAYGQGPSISHESLHNATSLS